MNSAKINYNGFSMYHILKLNIELFIMIRKLIHIFSVPKVRNENVFHLLKGSVRDCICIVVCC